MQPFKMADDIAQKDLFMRMVEMKLISKNTMVKELFPHIDYEKEQQTILAEALREQKDMIQVQIANQNAVSMLGVQVPRPTGATFGGDPNMPQHGALPEQNPPRAEGENAQI